MTFDTLGSRLIEIRKECGYKTKTALANMLGVSHVTVSAWEKNEYKPGGENLANLLDILGITKDWLYYGKKPKYDNIIEANKDDYHVKEQSSVYLGHVDVWDSSTPIHEDEIEVPYYMDVELAAGVGGELMEENQGYTLRFSKSTLRRCGVEARNAACVKVSGNSMEPRLFNGDVVGVDTGNRRIVDGDTYAINHGGLLRVKRLYRLPNGGVRVNSLNSEEHPDEMLSGNDAKGLSVIGRVFWHTSIW